MRLIEYFERAYASGCNAQERRKIVTLWFQSVCETLHEHKIDTDAVRPSRTGDYTIRAMGYWRSQPYEDLIELYRRLEPLRIKSRKRHQRPNNLGPK